METVVNAYRVRVNKMCASCSQRQCQNNGTRVCQMMGLVVEADYLCSHWEMSNGLKNAGMGGGVVRLKGTTEIVIS